MQTLIDFFEIFYGNKLDLNKMRKLSLSEGGVNFVGRSSQNNGVTATVALIDDLPPYEPGCITVALGGSYLLSSFVQNSPFYSAQNVAILRPRGTMSMAEKVYVCLCIQHNRFRYSAFGREANRTLSKLEIPEPSSYPDWLKNVDERTLISPSGHSKGSIVPFDPLKWKTYRLDKLFELKKGRRITKAQAREGRTPFIGPIAKRNGIARFIDQPPDHTSNTITVAYNGSVGEAFYQPAEFCASDDINILYPRFRITPAIGLFVTTVIRHEKFRFSYGRKWNVDRMNETTIRLPAVTDGEPDWEFMEEYIRSLPYGTELRALPSPDS